MKKGIDALLLAPLTLLLILLTPVGCATKAKPLVLELAPGVEMELVNVPAGEFLMGSTEGEDMTRANESPQHTIDLAEFYIGKHEVTNAQYRAFVQATGHKGEDNALVGQDGHPVLGVSWDDSVAFCAWASERTGRKIRLPTEAEWEKAARGTDGQRYPWGDPEPDETRCNYGKSRAAGGQMEVGRYSPEGDSPYGCVDMAGNVLEWTSSLLFDYPYDAEDGREDPNSRDARVVRGGGFFDNARDVRSANRNYGNPETRLSYIGFRVVASPS